MNDKTLNFIKKLEERHPGKYEILGEYVNGTTNIEYRCLKCGQIYNKMPNNIYRKNASCATCVNSKYNTEWFISKVKEIYGPDEYEVLGEYVNTKTKVKVRHNKCGNITDKVPNTLLCGCGCKYCNGGIKLTLDQVISRIKNNFKEEYDDYIFEYDTYESIQTKVNVKHKICENEYSIKYKHLIGKNFNRCPYCSGNRQKTHDEFKKEIFELVSNDYTLLSEYKNTHGDVLLRHNECGNEYYVAPTNFLTKNQRCPKCSKGNKVSKKETELLNYIKSIYDGEIIGSDRKVIGPKELDIYLPDKKIAIEFNGLIWHSEAFEENINTSINRHIIKTNECKKQGIRLIHVFEDEWDSNKKLVKKKIAHIIGCNDAEKIYARKCTIKEISNARKNDFLEKNHIQGKDISSIRLGLFYEDDLVSVMTFSKPRISTGHNNGNNKYSHELVRFASNINYVVVGGFSKLLAYFKRNYDYTRIITYADIRWSEGNVYYKNGFSLEHQSKPSYSYISNNLSNVYRYRLNRFTYRKSELEKKFPDSFSSNKSEVEIMHENGYSRIWDCGNYVFTLTRD